MTKWDWDKLKEQFENVEEEKKESEKNMKAWEVVAAIIVFALVCYGGYHFIFDVIGWFK